MDTQERKGTMTGMSEEKQDVMAAREIADSEITEPVFISPVQKHRGYLTTILAVLGLCAAFLLADLFYYGAHKDKGHDTAKYTSSVMDQPAQTQAVELPGLTVVAHRK